MENNLIFLAQSGAQQGSPLMQFLPFILLMVGFWFLLIQPQRKKQKEHANMLTQLKPGDKVITAGGIAGTITHVKKDRFQVKIDDNTRIDVLKGSIQALDTTES
ncbi:MAG: preprotein translocase subunit YajC [Puniceicoccaceae bacterium]